MSTRINADYNHDGRISNDEWDTATADMDRNDERRRYEVQVGDRTFTGTLSELEAQLRSSGILASSADAQSPSQNADANLATLKSSMDSVLAELQTARAQGDKEKEAQLVKQMQQLLQKAEQLNSQSSRPIDLSAYTAAVQENSLLGGAKATSVGDSGEGGLGTYGPQGSGGGTYTGRSAPGNPMNNATNQQYLPSTWKAQTTDATNPADNVDTSSVSYMAAQNLIDDANLDAFGQITDNQNRGKQLMMLFFYYAKMAESGDLGAMYQFMKFITYIVTKDKAQQQIEMGKKLIELQDLSRQWTDKLMNLTTDPNDPNAALKQTQMMTEVKAQTDTIALSQKLLGQTMDEFAQVNETLSGITKNLLDASSRVLRNMVRG